MQTESFLVIAPILGLLAAVLAVGAGFYIARRTVSRARSAARGLIHDARQEAQNQTKEILVASQERALAQQDELDRRDRELDERENRLEKRLRRIDRDASEQQRRKQALDQRMDEARRRETTLRESEVRVAAEREEVQRALERRAAMSVEEARAEILSRVEQSTRAEAGRLARKIEEEARQEAQREATNLMVQASQRVNIKDVVESTVSFIELPSDEMKGRIIGREGRNIRALELATGIDLIVDDTPRSILISSFDPVRRDVARVAIRRLVEDGRIHPARIEEVVQRAQGDVAELIEERGHEAAYGLGISDLHPRLVRLVGKMRYFTDHGQNLLQHCTETALIAGYMAHEVGARVALLQRAGLLHEVGRVAEGTAGQPPATSAELCATYAETEDVIQAVRCLQPNAEPRTIEAILLHAANRMSEHRSGARKENLAVFIERLKRLESLALGFQGVARAYAVKAGREIRVIVDAAASTDRDVHNLSKEIARALERELTYPGQIKVSVVRETRAVRYAV